MAWNDVYKSLFDFKEVVQQLLLGWGPQGIERRLDLSLSGITLGDTDFVTDHGSRKSTDRIYRIRCRRGDAAYVWLHLELQRKQDPWMPLRMLSYTIAIHERARRIGCRRLPLVLPFVLSHADRVWTSPSTFKALLEEHDESDPLADYQAGFKYFVLDSCSAPEQPEFPLLSGLLRAPYAGADMHYFLRALEGAKRIKNPAFILAFKSWMLNLAVRTRPNEARLMQQYYDEDADLDVLEAFARRCAAEYADLKQAGERAQRQTEAAQRQTEAAQRQTEAAQRQSEEGRRIACRTLVRALEARFSAEPQDGVLELSLPHLLGLVEELVTAPTLDVYRDRECDVLRRAKTP